jgi:hypothetical protein
MVLTYKLIDSLPSVVKHAHKTFAEKHKQEQKNYINNNWQELVTRYEKEKHLPYEPFNGQIAVLYINKNKNDATIKMVDSDFASLVASSKNPSDVRPMYGLGVSIIIKTNDNKYIIGSRDVSGTPGNRPAQFPAGYIERYEIKSENKEEQKKKFDNISTIQELKNFVLERAIQEAKEEVYGEIDIKDAKLIGAVFETKKWPSKTSDAHEKEIENLQGFIAFGRTELNSEEILAKRNKENTKDIYEMQELVFIDEKEFLEMTPESKVKLPLSGEQQLVPTHRIAPQILKSWLEEQQKKEVQSMIR